jgi:hypothetical protein
MILSLASINATTRFQHLLSETAIEGDSRSSPAKDGSMN